MIKRDYYLILGVSRSESEEGIKGAFRQLVKRYHPDIAGPMSRWEFQEIVEAYEVLSDEDRRKDYDRDLAHAEGRDRVTPESPMTGSFSSSRASYPRPFSRMKDLHSIGQSIDDLFDRIFESFFDLRTPRAQTPESLDMELVLSPEDALAGGEATVSIPVLSPCPECGGSGRAWPYECTYCGGSGVTEEEEEATILIPSHVESGTVFEYPLTALGIHDYSLRVVIRVRSFV